MAEADAENWLAGTDQVAQHWYGICRRGRRVTGPVRQENSVWPMAQDILGRGRGGNYGYPAAMCCEHPQYIEFGSIIDRDHVMSWAPLLTIAPLAIPNCFGPLVGLAAGDCLGEVHAFETRPLKGLRPQICDIDSPCRVMG